MLFQIKIKSDTLINYTSKIIDKENQINGKNIDSESLST